MRQNSVQEGSALLLLVLLMFFLVTAGSGLAALQLTHAKSIWVSHDANQAYYLAEAGVEDGIARWSALDKDLPSVLPFQGTVKDLQSQVVGSYDATVSVSATDSLIVSKGILAKDPSYLSLHRVTLDNFDGHVVDWSQQ